MKKILQLTTLILLVSILSISASKYAVNGKRIVRTIEKEETKELVWHEYMDAAYEKSKASGKPILANFTGSDWCGWCIRLKNEVFNTEEFKTWSNENVVLLELDYPRKTKLPEALATQNAQLQQVFQVTGYPTIWLFNLTLDPQTKKFDIAPLGKTGYVAGGPSVWIQGAEQIIANGATK